MKKLIFYLFFSCIYLQPYAQTLVQKAGGFSSSSAVNSITVTLTSTPTEGNTLIAVVSVSSSNSNMIGSITQTGVVWAKAVSSASTYGTSTEIWYSTSIAAGASKTITITNRNSLLSRTAAFVSEYSGLQYGSPFDQSASNAASLLRQPISTGTTPTTTSAQELLIAGLTYIYSSVSIWTGPPTNSFVKLDSITSSTTTSSTNVRLTLLERKVSSTLQAQTQATLSNPSNTSAAIATFKVNTTSRTWLGYTTDWNTASNWENGSVPDLTSDVTLPASPVGGHQPTIGATGGTCKTLTINSGATLTMGGAYALNLYGNMVNNGTFNYATSTVTIKDNATLSGSSTSTFYHLTIDAGKTFTAPTGTVNIKGNFTNNGTFTHSNGTVVFNGTAASQTLGGSTATGFYNLTVSNSAYGVQAVNNISVANILNLGANPSATVGALEMVSSYTGYPATNATYATQSTNPITSYILTMGANATTDGTGDVTGKIYRNSMVANTEYSFGNKFTTVASTVAPTDMTMTVTIGTAYGQAGVWGDVNAVKRTYELVPTGGTGATLNINLHYLDAELNGNAEEKLVTGDYDIGPNGAPLGDEHGRSSYDITDNHIGLSGLPIGYLQGKSYRTIFILHQYYTGKTTWTGSVSTDWNNNLNWTNNKPGTLATAVIPDATTTNNDPILPANQTIGGMQILSGGVLDLNSQTITIAGFNYNGWEDESGLSNYTNSTVILQNTAESGETITEIPITGIPRFNNLTIAAAASVKVSVDSHVYIAGSLVNNGTFNASAFNNIVEYDGASPQNILSPNNASYYSLILSGAGTKTFPASTLTLLSDLTLNANFTASSNTLVFAGTSAQTISGSSVSSLNNVTLNNSNGLTLSKNQTLSGTLTLTNGLLSTGSNTLTVSATGSISGGSATSYVNGKLAREFSGATAKTYPIGKGGVYRPLTFTYNTLSGGNSTIQVEQFETVIPGSIPALTDYYASRYWTLSETSGAGNGNYQVTLNATGFTPSTAKVLRGDGSTNTLYTASYSAPNITSATLTDNTFGNFAAASACASPVINTQPSAEIVRADVSIASFTVIPESGSFTYAWEVNSGSGWTTVSNNSIYSNATTSTLTITHPPIGMNNYQYRAVVTNSCGASTTTNTALLTVYTGNVTWTGSTSRDWFVAANWSPQVVPSSIDDVLVPSAPSNQPLVSSNWMIYANDLTIQNGASLTLSGGQVLDIAGNLTNSGTLTIGTGSLSIGQNTTIINNGTIETKNTSATPIPYSSNYASSGTIKFSGTAKQTLANGTYNNIQIANTVGVQLQTDGVVTVNGTLQINAGAKFEIGTSQLVTANQIVNNGGTSGITLKSAADAPNGSLVYHNAAGSPIQATVEMYSKAFYTTQTGYKWQYFGTPIVGANVESVFSVANYVATVRKYDETNIDATGNNIGLWDRLNVGDVMNIVDGYQVSQSAATKYSFKGTLYNQDISKSLAVTSGADWAGNHILANPYTAAIRISNINFGTAEAAVYIYNTGSLQDWTNNNGGGSTTDGTAGTYSVSTSGFAGVFGIPVQIPSMQGFLVKTSQPTTIQIPYSAVIQNSTSQRVKQLDQQQHVGMMIELNTQSSVDKAWLFVDPKYSTGYDNGYDGKKMLASTTKAQLYVQSSDADYQIAALNDLNNTELAFCPGTASQFSLKFSHLNTNKVYDRIYLWDKVTNTTVDISFDGAEYRFTADPSTSISTRFKLLTSTTGTETSLDAQKLSVTNNGNILVVSNDLTSNATVMVYGADGRLLMSKTIQPNSKENMATHLKSGVYVIKAIVGEVHFSKKLIVN